MASGKETASSRRREYIKEHVGPRPASGIAAYARMKKIPVPKAAAEWRELSSCEKAKYTPSDKDIAKYEKKRKEALAKMPGAKSGGKMSAYNKFVKENSEKVRKGMVKKKGESGAEFNQRALKEIAALWKQKKGSD